jgi:acyl-CoA thioesterase-2
MVGDPLATLLDLLDLETIEDRVFRGRSPDETRQRVFGGQVAAQALVAAGRTVEVGRVHSLHAYFLRPGDPSVPILYEVEVLRDGRSFTTRRVVAIQRGEVIFDLACSFHRDEVGLSHQDPMPSVPAPEEVPALAERLAPYLDQLPEFFTRPQPIEHRFIGELPWLATSEPRSPSEQLWLRAAGTLPADPLLHAAIVTYASDMTLFDAILAPHGIRWEDEDFMAASLDHCMWFHRPVVADQWLLFDEASPTAAGARGLASGRLYDRSGQLMVSVVQEGLIRLRRDAVGGQ